MVKRLIIIGLILLLPTSAWGLKFATPPFTAMSPQGRPLVGASVSVVDAISGAPVAAYNDSAGTNLYPGVVPPTGLVQFYADQGSYRITVSGQGVTHIFIADIPAGTGGLDDSDFSNTTPPGFLFKDAASVYQIRRVTITSSDPSDVTHNVTAGYGSFSFWINTTSDEAFICADCRTDGTTNWKSITATANVQALENADGAGVGVFSAMDGTTGVFRTIDGEGGIDVSLDGDRIVVDGSGIMGGGITSLNGLTDTTQTFATGTAGTTFNITDNGSNQHIFNLPDASITNRGLINTTTQTISGPKTLLGPTALYNTTNFAGNVIVNEVSDATTTFRVETDNMPAAIYTSAPNDSVCINDFTCAGPETFHVVANAGNTGIDIDSTSGNALVATATAGDGVSAVSSTGSGLEGISGTGPAGLFVRTGIGVSSGILEVIRFNNSDLMPAIKLLHGSNTADIILANDGSNDEFQITANGEVRAKATISDTAITPAFSYVNDVDTGMDTNAAGEPIIVDEGTIIGRFGSSNISMYRDLAVSETSLITSSYGSVLNAALLANPAGDSSASYYGAIVSSRNDPGETVNFTGNDNLVGLNAYASSNTSGNTTEIIGAQFSAEKLGTGPLTRMTALEASLNNANASGTIAIGVSLLIPAPVNVGTITDLYGIRQLGSEGNALGGSLAIGSAALPTLDVLEVTGDSTFFGELKITGVAGSGKAVCVKANGYLGECSDAVGGSGTCTCG